MIPVVEDYLNEILEEKIQFLRKNPEHVDLILLTSERRRESFKKYIQNTPIKVIKGYPRVPAELPSICILLSNESESQEGLGDYTDEERIYNSDVTEELFVIDNDYNIPFPHVITTHRPISGVQSVTHNDFGVLLDTHQYEIFDAEKGIIALPIGVAEHGDSITASYVYNEFSSEGVRVKYEANFRLEVWATNADLVVELYHIVKWALLSSRDYLGSEKNIFRQKLGGSDYEPVPTYFPEFVYRRSLQFWCEFNASVQSNLNPYIQSVETNMEVSPYY